MNNKYNSQYSTTYLDVGTMKLPDVTAKQCLGQKSLATQQYIKSLRKYVKILIGMITLAQQNFVPETARNFSRESQNLNSDCIHSFSFPSSTLINRIKLWSTHVKISRGLAIQMICSKNAVRLWAFWGIIKRKEKSFTHIKTSKLKMVSARLLDKKRWIYTHCLKMLH